MAPLPPQDFEKAKKPRRTASLRGLMNQANVMKEKRNDTTLARSALGQRPTGIMKHLVADSALLAHYAQPNHEPVLNCFLDATKSYSNASAISKESLLKPIYEELIARVDGVDMLGKPLVRPGFPTKEDFSRLYEEEERLSKPLNEEVLDIQFTQPDGSKILRQIRLGDTWTKFQHMYDRKHKQIDDVEAQLRAVEDEIDAVKTQVLGGEPAIREAIRSRDRQLAELDRQAEEIEKQAKEDSEQVQAEEKAAAKALNKKVKEFWESME